MILPCGLSCGCGCSQLPYHRARGTTFTYVDKRVNGGPGIGLLAALAAPWLPPGGPRWPPRAQPPGSADGTGVARPGTPDVHAFADAALLQVRAACPGHPRARLPSGNSSPPPPSQYLLFSASLTLVSKDHKCQEDLGPLQLKTFTLSIFQGEALELWLSEKCRINMVFGAHTFSITGSSNPVLPLIHLHLEAGGEAAPNIFAHLISNPTHAASQFFKINQT